MHLLHGVLAILVVATVSASAFAQSKNSEPPSENSKWRTQTKWVGEVIGSGGSVDKQLGAYDSYDEAEAACRFWSENHPKDLRLTRTRETKVRVRDLPPLTPQRQQEEAPLERKASSGSDRPSSTHPVEDGSGLSSSRQPSPNNPNLSSSLQSKAGGSSLSSSPSNSSEMGRVLGIRDKEGGRYIDADEYEVILHNGQTYRFSSYNAALKYKERINQNPSWSAKLRPVPKAPITQPESKASTAANSLVPQIKATDVKDKSTDLQRDLTSSPLAGTSWKKRNFPNADLVLSFNVDGTFEHSVMGSGTWHERADLSVDAVIVTPSNRFVEKGSRINARIESGRLTLKHFDSAGDSLYNETFSR
jgi:hypothetical protein